jgi:hypothetical protein
MAEEGITATAPGVAGCAANFGFAWQNDGAHIERERGASGAAFIRRRRSSTTSIMPEAGADGL